LTKKVWIIPAVIAVLSAAGMLGASKISLPTLTHIYDGNFKGDAATADLVVDGVKCYGTSDLLRRHIEQVPGLVSLVAYGGRHRVVLRYDPGKTGPRELAAAIEQPIMTKDGPQAYFKVTSAQTK
jgi:hypothetical protein